MKQKIFRLLYILLIIIYIISFFKIRELPFQNEIVDDLMWEPIQTETDREDFSFVYRDVDYHVKTQADYELWGLVVSINNIGAWYNYYHDENSVNLKDVCVIWGDNLSSNAYRNVKYKSGEWTCYWNWYGNIGGKFYGNKLSNNHLLSDSKEMRDIIKKVRIGDQVKMKGALVDYSEKGTSYYRRTSLSRDDTNKSSRSGGACEVFFVDDIEILKKGMPYWYMAKDWSKRAFIFLIILQILMFFVKNKKALFKS
ncbi:hypothetical protein KAI92_03280 [Candidatus Parcubacteria bacterium]|nr:hypothetical protein [Candidatus Parcubacteria bacterium]